MLMADKPLRDAQREVLTRLSEPGTYLVFDGDTYNYWPTKSAFKVLPSTFFNLLDREAIEDTLGVNATIEFGHLKRIDALSDAADGCLRGRHFDEAVKYCQESSYETRIANQPHYTITPKGRALLKGESN